MKLVLHNVRDMKLPKGGVLTLFTDDQKPLKPPDGSLAWLSQNMLTNFYFHYSIHYVRAVPGSEKLSKLDETNISEIEAPSIASMITSNCIIKKNWIDENDNFAMRVFTTPAAEQGLVTHHSGIF